MRKQHRIVPFILPILFCIASAVHAEEQHPFETGWYDIGYTSVDEAITKCDKLFQKHISLPTRLPPITFTHQFGRCNNLADHLNDSLEIEYIHEHAGMKHYMIWVRPLKYKIPIRQRLIKGVYTLQDESKAVLFRIREDASIDTLVFEKNGWQYMLTIDCRGLSEASSDVLVKIANTIK